MTWTIRESTTVLEHSRFQKSVCEFCREHEEYRMQNKKGDQEVGMAGGQKPQVSLHSQTQYFGVLLNLFKKPPNLALEGAGSAASNLVCLLLPKQTVQPARSKRTNETNVIQKAGAVLVVKLELFKPPTRFLTNAKRAISMMNAMKVRVAARNDTREARRVTVMWVEKERRRAMNDTTAAVENNVLGAPHKTRRYDPPMTYRLGEPPSLESSQA